MRKRLRRRLRDPKANPMFESGGPIAERDLLDLRLREHLALDDLTHWSGHPADLRTLRITAAVARLLTAVGIGTDELGGLDAADKVLRKYRVNPPGITGVCEADQAPLRWLLVYADAQRAVASCREYRLALARMRQQPSLYGA